MRSMTQLHVVTGATGALGSALVHHLAAEGLPVRALVRNMQLARSMLPEGTEIVTVDASDPASLSAGLAGAGVIYNSLYVPHQLEAVADVLLEAARVNQARLIFPSNAEVYGLPQSNPMTEAHPLHPINTRGTRRMTLEQKLLNTAGAAVVIARLAPLYGAHITGSFMSSIFENAMRGKKAHWLGRLDALHSVLYVPDAAAVCVALGTADDAEGDVTSAVWHVNGGAPVTGAGFLNMVYKAYGVVQIPAVRTRRMFKLVGLLVPEARRLLDVLYQFETPFVLDGARLAGRFPDFDYTPRDDGIQDTAGWFKAEFDDSDVGQMM